MKHRKKPCKTYQKITIFIKRKVSTPVLRLPVTVQYSPSATQITFEESESLLKSRNENMIEQRRQERFENMEKRRKERLEDFKKLNL